MSCSAQGTFEPIHITFDGAPVVLPGWDIGVTEYYEHGMSFNPLGAPSPGNHFGRTGGGIPERPENGTAYINGDWLVFRFLDNSAFNLISVDLAEYSTLFSGAETVPFIGHRVDGSVVSTSFTTDGVMDGTGPIADFETFTFGPEFSHLLRVEIPPSVWSLDNLHLNRAIPEPNVSVMLILGGAILVSRRVRHPPLIDPP